MASIRLPRAGEPVKVGRRAVAQGHLAVDDMWIAMPSRGHGKTAAARRELAALRRDAAISLLLEVPVECSERAEWRRIQEALAERYHPPSSSPEPASCGKCWTCRVDKFLRDAGVRR